jgi:hypothetical protein
MVNQNLRLPYVKHHNHSTSSLQRRKPEELSIPPRAKLPVFIVGEQPAKLFLPLEFDLAQRDNREQNTHRSRSRTGSLTSHIYDDLPLSAVCGTVPTAFVYDDHPLVSPRPPLGESMKSWPQMKGGAEVPLTKSLWKVQQLLGVSPTSDGSLPSQYRQKHHISTFSDSSSEYSQKIPLSDPNNRSSWTSTKGKIWLEQRPSPLEEGQPAPTSLPSAFISSPQSQNIHTKFVDKKFLGQDLQMPQPLRPQRPAPPEVRPSQKMTSMHDMLESRPSDFERGHLKTPTREEVLATNRYQKKPSYSRTPSDPAKQHQQLTIRTKPSTKRSKVHFSPSFKKRASDMLEGARESFARGVEEISSPVSSRSNQNFFQSPTASDYQGSATPKPNTPLTPFPDFHQTSRREFFPDASPILEHAETNHKSPVRVSRKASKYRKFGWNTGKHPLKSPHPDSKGNIKTMVYGSTEERHGGATFTKDSGVLGIIANTKMRIAGLSSSPNEKDRKKSGSIITNHQRSYQGPTTPFPLSTSQHLAHVTLAPSPITENGVAAGIATTLRGVAGWKTKEERRELDEKRSQEEKKRRRREILSRGIKFAGEPEMNPGTMVIERQPYITPAILPKPPVGTEMRGALNESPPRSASAVRPRLGRIGTSSPATPSSAGGKFGAMGEPIPSPSTPLEANWSSHTYDRPASFVFRPVATRSAESKVDGTEWL